MSDKFIVNILYTNYDAETFFCEHLKCTKDELIINPGKIDSRIIKRDIVRYYQTYTTKEIVRRPVARRKIVRR